jgi:uridylate kinase
MCRDNNLPIVVFNMRTAGNIARAVSNESGLGTLVCMEKQ